MSLTYEKAGVPHLKGDPKYNKQISSLIKSTHVPGVTGSSTGFAALFDFKKLGFKDPLLVSCTDGVGTKLEIARLQNRHDTIGIDLVAMCVNDMICGGAKPLFFLDYFATGKFDDKVTLEVLKGVVKGCRESGCALVGGETAIMPGFYQMNAGSGVPEYDIAGFSVGLVERKKLIDGQKIKAGDAVIGIASSGFHSNGYSLLRKVFSKKELKGRIGKELLTPTKIYVKPILKLLNVGATRRVARTNEMGIKGIVNITGGGLIDNLPRVLPKGLGANIYIGSWKPAKIFSTVQDSGNISTPEMFRAFNMGIGMSLIVGSKETKKVLTALKQLKLKSWEIGKIVKGKKVDLV